MLNYEIHWKRLRVAVLVNVTTAYKVCKGPNRRIIVSLSYLSFSSTELFITATVHFIEAVNN